MLLRNSEHLITPFNNSCNPSLFNAYNSSELFCALLPTGECEST